MLRLQWQLHTTHPIQLPLPSIVHWLVAALVGIFGVALAAVGSFLSFFLDQAMVSDAVSSGETTSVMIGYTLTDAEATALGTDVANWTGIGLLVTGIALTGFAAVYGVRQYRLGRQTDAGTDSQRAWQAATVGAVVAAIFPFVPLSPLLGGGVAGYLSPSRGDRTARVGALAGLLVATPAVLISGFTTVGLYAGLAVFAESGVRVLTTGLLAIGVLFVLLMSVGLGGLGGYLARVVGDR
jgi:hypothetical protein